MDDDIREWFTSFIAEVDSTICDALGTDARFDASHLVQRFRTAGDLLLERGLEALAQFEEAHNELVVAHEILRVDSDPACVALEYEPLLEECANRIDFRAELSDGLVLWLEVKTIHPPAKDTWENFVRIVDAGLLPDRVVVSLDPEWMGGELWHSWYASRARMLGYALDFEERIEKCDVAGEGTRRVLVLCGDDFSWHVDQLEDFVTYYQTGIHRSDDPMGKMEAHHVLTNSIEITRRIDHFSAVMRPNTSVTARRVEWSVRPRSRSWLDVAADQ